MHEAHAGHEPRAGHMAHEGHMSHEGHAGMTGHGHMGHHAMMVTDFRRRFWVSLALTVPVLALAPMIQGFLGLRDVLRFPGDGYVQFVLASVIFFYGGRPFFKGIYDELGK